MPYTVIESGVPDNHACDTEENGWPWAGSFPQGVVIQCDECGKYWYVDKFILWSECGPNYEPPKG